MTAAHTTDASAVTTAGTAGALTGLGILTMVLFPLSIPFLLLTAVFVAPLALVGVVAALAAGVVAGVALAIRAIARKASGTRGRQERPEPFAHRASRAGHGVARHQGAG